MNVLVEAIKTTFMWWGIVNVLFMLGFAGLIWWETRGQVRR